MAIDPEQLPHLGVLGGLGPLASARFISSLYRGSAYASEQQMPRISLYSDPTFPDRTHSFLRGDTQEILRRTISALESLLNQGADHLLMCCFTIHHIFPELPKHLQSKLIHLPSLAARQISKEKKPALMFCTTGSRKLRVFEQAPNWAEAAKYVMYLSDVDQAKVHQIIYRLKLNADPITALRNLREVADKYTGAAWVFGCTDLHLLSNLRTADIAAAELESTIDPLLVLVEKYLRGSFYELLR